MSEYDDTNRGVLFKNDQKGNEKAPVYKGKINVDGVEKSLSAWINKSKGGQTYMSLQVSEPFKKEDAQESEPLNDDIPF